MDEGHGGSTYLSLAPMPSEEQQPSATLQPLLTNCPRPTHSYPHLDQHRVQRVRGALAVAVHVLLQVGAQVLKHQVQAGLVVLLQVLHAQQPAAGAQEAGAPYQGAAAVDSLGPTLK